MPYAGSKWQAVVYLIVKGKEEFQKMLYLAGTVTKSSDDQSVGDVSAGSLGRPDDFDDLASLEAEVASHGVSALDPHQLVVLQLVPDQDRMSDTGQRSGILK